MTEANLTYYAVEAPRASEFPLDMLRHAQSFPFGPSDAGTIGRHVIDPGGAAENLPPGGKVRINLCTHLDPFGMSFAEAARRWRSFGWTALIRDKEDVEGSYLDADGRIRLHFAHQTFADLKVA